jgi:hypothetical protein
MAKDLTPDAWFASWSEDGTNITLPIASVTGLVASEADTTTGDIRTVLLKMLSRVKTVYDGLADADKPDTVTITEITTAGSREFRFRVTGSVGTFTPGTDA